MAENEIASMTTTSSATFYKQVLLHKAERSLRPRAAMGCWPRTLIIVTINIATMSRIPPPSVRHRQILHRPIPDTANRILYSDHATMRNSYLLR